MALRTSQSNGIENSSCVILIIFPFSPLVAEEKQVTEPVKALPVLETADTVLSGSSNENVQTNGIPDDGQSISSTDNLVNDCTGCQYISTKEEMFFIVTTNGMGFGGRKEQKLSSVCPAQVQKGSSSCNLSIYWKYLS